MHICFTRVKWVKSQLTFSILNLLPAKFGLLILTLKVKWVSCNTGGLVACFSVQASGWGFRASQTLSSRKKWCLCWLVEAKWCINASVNYRNIANMRRTESPNLNVSCLVLQLSLPDPMKPGVNTWRPRENGRRFADDSYKCIFFNEDFQIWNKISLKFVPKGQINKVPSLVLIMAWRRPGDKPLSEPMMARSLTHICVTRPQWVKSRMKM